MADFALIEINQPPPSVAGANNESAIFQRDPVTFGRPWIVPGTPGLMHRLGGLETDIRTGHLSNDAENHQLMSQMRADKVASVAQFLPPQEVELGPRKGNLAVVGWGSTFGPIYQAVRGLRDSGYELSQVHIRHLNPFPHDLGTLLAGFDRLLVPEMNMGQLSTLIRDRFELATIPLSNVTGQPFKVSDLVEAIRSRLPQPEGLSRPAQSREASL